ncbi:MAG: nitroreductase, partial [Nitrospira sp. CR2.1]|nr:nitroreductase [Nitrospira sp. CR2.1]
GVRGTGIGCFFDDPVHEVVGMKNLALQSLYHFTIGGPVDDERLMTLPPYHHLARRS